MKGIYLTKQGKQEIEAKIANLEQQIKISESSDDRIRAGIETFEKKVYEEFLSSATILPVEESWEEIFSIHGMSKVITNFSSIYPQGVIIQPK
jgi:hypothetical protein